MPGRAAEPGQNQAFSATARTGADGSCCYTLRHAGSSSGLSVIQAASRIPSFAGGGAGRHKSLLLCRGLLHRAT